MLTQYSNSFFTQITCFVLLIASCLRVSLFKVKNSLASMFDAMGWLELPAKQVNRPRRTRGLGFFSSPAWEFPSHDAISICLM